MRNKIIVFFSISILLGVFVAGSFALAQVAAMGPPEANTNITISMDFEDADLNDVLKIFSQQSGLNFIAAEEVRGKKVTMYMDSVSVQDALNSIINANNLTYEQPAGSNIFVVRSQGISPVKVMTKVYYLKNARVPNSVLNKDIESRLSGDEEGGGDSGSEGGGSEGGDEESDLLAIVENVITEYGSVTEDPRTNSLIVTDVPAQFHLIDQVVAGIDVKVPQVLLEVEMLDVSKRLLDDIGLKWPSTWVQYGSSTTATMNTSWPVPGDKVINRLSDSTLLGSPWTAVADLQLFPNGISLDLIRTDSSTRYLARPRIMTLSNEAAEILITQDEAIGNITVVAGGGEGVSTGTTQAERATTGISLRVTPHVNEDDETITIYVEPTVIKTGTSNSSVGTYLDPETRQTKSVVRLKDGEMIVLGGLIKTDKQNTLTKVPFLGDIPVLGKLFTHSDDTAGEERELIVFITPHIVEETPLTTETAADREQSLPFESYAKEQTTVIDRERKIGETLDQVVVEQAIR